MPVYCQAFLEMANTRLNFQKFINPPQCNFAAFHNQHTHTHIQTTKIVPNFLNMLNINQKSWCFYNQGSEINEWLWIFQILPDEVMTKLAFFNRIPPFRLYNFSFLFVLIEKIEGAHRDKSFHRNIGNIFYLHHFPIARNKLIYCLKPSTCNRCQWIKCIAWI